MKENLWLEGVQLWYNGEYLRAIEIWEYYLENLIEWGDEGYNEDCISTFSLLREPLQEISESDNIARLLLFLAGCQLDSQQIYAARRSLIRCLRCCSYFDSTAHLAIQELLCSYDEDVFAENNCEKKLEMCRKFVEFGINQGCLFWANKFQRPGYMFTELKAHGKPYYNMEERPEWCKLLEKEEIWKRIRDEYYRLARGGSSVNHWPDVGAGGHRGGAGQHDHKVVDGEWKEVVLFGSGARPDLAPFTSKFLQKHIPEATSLANQGGGEVIFSVLGPDTRIRTHCGSTNLRLTAHLGLFVPSSNLNEGKNPDCAIRIADNWHSWEEGKVLVFDDSFEHEVRNLTTQHRAVLLLRFWHPKLDTSSRAKALNNVVDAKELDTLRRYNPPLPFGYLKGVEERGLEQSKCRACFNSGYTSIRLEYVNDPKFICSCGHPII